MFDYYPNTLKTAALIKTDSKGYKSKQKINCFFVDFRNVRLGRNSLRDNPEGFVQHPLHISAVTFFLFFLGRVGWRWPSGRASDSGSRAPGFEPRGRHEVSCSKTF